MMGDDGVGGWVVDSLKRSQSPDGRYLMKARKLAACFP